MNPPIPLAIIGCACFTLLAFLLTDIHPRGLAQEAIPFLLLLIPCWRTAPPPKAERAVKVGLVGVCGLGLLTALLLVVLPMLGVALIFVAYPLQLLMAVGVVIVALLAKRPQQG